MADRADLIREVADRLAAARSGEHALRVGIDGICGAGKTMFARDLTEALTGRRVDAVHLDSDGFHNVRAVRHRQGSDSARGYYEDAYDFDALADRVLHPLGLGGTGIYATRVHDLGTDEVIDGETASAAPDAIVLFDCTFLQRGALRGLWDEVIFLRTDRAIASRRGLARDAGRMGGPDAAQVAYETRYMAACDIYLAEERPAQRASIVIDHDDPGSPTVQRTPGCG